MLEKTNYQGTAPTSVQPISANDTKVVHKSSPVTASVIGTDVVFKGEMMAGNDILIHGTFEGMIARHTKNVTVGKDGKVKAMIHAATVTVRGHVDGDIYGDDLVELMEGSKVDGNIYCSCVRIQKGAQFNGSVKMA